MHASIETARTIEEVRLCEAKCAAIYWNSWTNVSIRLRPRDISRVPVSWTRYETRKSTLTGAPRAATNPINSLLNYSYSLLESEARLALLSVGLDPTLGILHADQRNRDSFALDAMEPVRPMVDAFILDLLEERILTSRDFVELPNGVCRVRAPMTHDLALTLPRWRQLMAPVATDLAQAFRRVDPSAVTLAAAPHRRLSQATRTPASSPSPLLATPRRKRPQRPYASKAWGTPRPEPLLLTPNACARCNEPVVKRRRKHCDKCIPGVRADHARKIVVVARATLAVQTAAGEDPRKDPEVNRRRGRAIAQGHRRNRERSSDYANDGRDEKWFHFHILRKLDEVPLSQIAAVTGLSLAACSRFRAGKRVPHKRHWTALEAMLKDLMG
jgi:hypothetical protein